MINISKKTLSKKTLLKIISFSLAVIAVTAFLMVSVFYSYYTKLLDSGDFISASEEVKKLTDVLNDNAVNILIVIVFAIIISVFLSIRITKSIVKPVEELASQLDEIDNIETYSELEPFVTALQEQRKKRKVLDRQKKQFTANVSHELKTPLTSIAGYAELIETGIAKEEDIRPFASTIRKQALRLVTLSEDIIKLSQLEEDENVKVSFSSTDIYEVAKRCTEALSINARLKNVTMELKGKSAFIKANPPLIEELIYNLCDNAIRYNTDGGSVTVEILQESGETRLTVSDTGIGIDSKYQERIFERFFRVDKSRSKETGGTGLGLAIVKHIVQLHNAEMSVDSCVGKGTAISIKFKDS